MSVATTQQDHRLEVPVLTVFVDFCDVLQDLLTAGMNNARNEFLLPLPGSCVARQQLRCRIVQMRRRSVYARPNEANRITVVTVSISCVPPSAQLFFVTAYLLLARIATHHLQIAPKPVLHDEVTSNLDQPLRSMILCRADSKS